MLIGRERQRHNYELLELASFLPTLLIFTAVDCDSDNIRDIL
jgi:hypothetical protein